MGQSEVALNHLERTMDAMGDEEWVHGSLVAALLNHDAGRHLTAINAVTVGFLLSLSSLLRAVAAKLDAITHHAHILDCLVLCS